MEAGGALERGASAKEANRPGLPSPTQGLLKKRFEAHVEEGETAAFPA